MTESDPRQSHPDSVPSDALAAPPASLRSEVLLAGQREVLIIHAQDVYRLRVTRNGKLILTK